MKQVKKIQENKNKKAKPSKIKPMRSEETNEAVKLFWIIVVVVIIFALFFLLTYLLNNKEEDKKTTEIQYSEIMVGSIWNQSGNYYVLIGYSDDENLSIIDLYLSRYTANTTEENKMGYYVVNLDSVFNKAYVADKSNIFVKEHSDIRFSGLTLLLVKDGNIDKAYEGKDSIMSYVKGLE